MHKGKDKNLNLNDSGALPESGASYAGASNGALTSGRFTQGQAGRDDLKRGFVEVEDAPQANPYPGELAEGGFLKRPEGWER